MTAWLRRPVSGVVLLGGDALLSCTRRVPLASGDLGGECLLPARSPAGLRLNSVASLSLGRISPDLSAPPALRRWLTGLTTTPDVPAIRSVELATLPQSSLHRDRHSPRLDSASSKCRSVGNQSTRPHSQGGPSVVIKPRLHRREVGGGLLDRNAKTSSPNKMRASKQQIAPE